MKVKQRVTMESEDGPCVAVKERPGEAWEIADPYGDQRFYGTKPEVKRVMRKRIAAHVGETEAA